MSVEKGGTAANYGHNIRRLHGTMDELSELPPAGTYWLKPMLADHQRHIVRRNQETWALIDHGVTKYQYPNGQWRYCTIWETNPALTDALDRLEPSGPELPCGHHGFTNLGDGQYACLADWCDAVHSRADLEEAFADE